MGSAPSDMNTESTPQDDVGHDYHSLNNSGAALVFAKRTKDDCVIAQRYSARCGTRTKTGHTILQESSESNEQIDTQPNCESKPCRPRQRSRQSESRQVRHRRSSLQPQQNENNHKASPNGSLKLKLMRKYRTIDQDTTDIAANEKQIHARTTPNYDVFTIGTFAKENFDEQKETQTNTGVPGKANMTSKNNSRRTSSFNIDDKDNDQTTVLEEL